MKKILLSDEPQLLPKPVGGLADPSGRVVLENDQHDFFCIWWLEKKNIQHVFFIYLKYKTTAKYSKRRRGSKLK